MNRAGPHGGISGLYRPVSSLAWVVSGFATSTATRIDVIRLRPLDLCLRLATDDGIHHGAGMAYERVLLTRADRKTKARLIDAANRLLPVFVDHAMWRPKERALVGGIMRERDLERVRMAVEDGIRIAASLGLDAGEIDMPV